jgi:uncharacterized protein YacL (UPF0231 family)
MKTLIPLSLSFAYFVLTAGCSENLKKANSHLEERVKELQDSNSRLSEKLQLTTDGKDKEIESLRINNEELKKKLGDYQNTTVELQGRIKKQAEQIRKQSEHFLHIANEKQTIRDFELFLEAESQLEPEFKSDKTLVQEAYRGIHDLIRKADLIEGYQYFLRKYGDKPLAQEQTRQASDRLCQIAYQIAEQQDTIPAFAAFEVAFHTADPALLDNAWRRAILLEEQTAREELKGQLVKLESDGLKNDFVPLLRRTFIEEIGNRLYREAVRARKEGDLITFKRKYGTILEGALFSDSNLRAQLELNRELKEILEDLQRDSEKMRALIRESNETVLAKYDAVNMLLTGLAKGESEQKASLEKLIEGQFQLTADYEKQKRYFEAIAELVRLQNTLIEQYKPDGWKEDLSLFLNFARLGLAVIPHARPAYMLLKGLKR